MATVRYEVRGAARTLMLCKDGEILLSGPAGTGKSRGCLEKVHLCAVKYAGCRWLIARKTLSSLVGTGLVTYREKVLHADEGVVFFGGSKDRPAAYRYPNGSEIVVGGLDKATKIMSTEYDGIYVQEATELAENDWEALTTRLRNGVMPYQQLIGDCNPESPTHWLKRRCDRGATRELLSRHEDNARYYDARTKTWTPEGLAYLERLGGLTGVRLRRLRDGEWAAAEGTVYDQYDRSIHLIDRFEIPDSWPRYRSIDFGFTNPFSCSWWAKDPDGRLYLYRQLYRTQTLAEDHARRIVALSAGERYVATVADHDAEDRATLERHGVPTVPAYKKISPGIQAMQSRLKVAGDGKPRLFIMRDSLVERDEALAERKRPLNTEQEFDSYVWAKDQDGKAQKEAPVDENNHGCLVSGTIVTTRRGDVPIETIVVGDDVLTRAGYRPVLAAGLTARAAQVVTVELTNGQHLTGTPNHPVLTREGWMPMGALEGGQRVWTSKDVALAASSVSRSRAWSIDDIRTPRPSPIACITAAFRRIMRTVGDLRSTVTCGSMPTAPSLTVTTFTTRMGTLCTTPSITSSACLPKSTTVSIHRTPNSVAPSRTSTWIGSGLRRTSGTPPLRGSRGTANRPSGSGRNEHRSRSRATNAANLSVASAIRRTTASVPTTASRPGDARPAWTTRTARAPGAAVCSGATSTRSRGTAPVRVRRVTEHRVRRDVYNLTVADAPEYIANGVLVHNCDEARYLVAYVDKIAENVKRTPWNAGMVVPKGSVMGRRR